MMEVNYTAGDNKESIVIRPGAMNIVFPTA
jgi:hypothetical protein